MTASRIWRRIRDASRSVNRKLWFEMGCTRGRRAVEAAIRSGRSAADRACAHLEELAPWTPFKDEVGLQVEIPTYVAGQRGSGGRPEHSLPH